MMQKIKALRERIKKLHNRFINRKRPEWYKNTKRKVKHLFTGKNLSKLVILFATLALIATSVLPYLL